MNSLLLSQKVSSTTIQHLRKLYPPMDKNSINLLPITTWEGPIMVIKNNNSLEKALPSIKKEYLLGFDTETRPTFTKGDHHLPAIIQIATEQTVYIIQLQFIDFSGTLIEVLSSPDYIKAGVAIQDDMIGLSRISPFQADGLLDLASAAGILGIEARGLKTMAASVLGFRIVKKARCSNWQNPILTPQQIKYAATDAWLSRELCIKFLPYLTQR